LYQSVWALAIGQALAAFTRRFASEEQQSQVPAKVDTMVFCCGFFVEGFLGCVSHSLIEATSTARGTLKEIKTMRIFIFLLLAAAAGYAQCNPKTIDDFTTGQTTSQTTLRIPKTNAYTFQNASGVPGGVREVFYQLDANTFDQPSEFDIVKTSGGGALVATNGPEEFFEMQVVYGVDTRGNAAPLGFTIPSNCDRFRVTFDSNVATLSFMFEAYTRNSNGSTTGFADGIGLPPVVAGFPGCVDFPFANFVTNTQGAVQNFAHAPTDLIVLALAPGSAVGGNSFAITKIEATDNRLPPSQVACVVANNGK
jgi:hypothetical protein